MATKVIKLQDNDNNTLIPVTDASVIQIAVDGRAKSVKDVILENEKVVAASHNALNDRIAELENASYITATSLTSTLSSYVTSGYYDSSTHKIYLRHDTDVLSYIDVTDFIKDGMVDTAYVQGSNLVISFNGDAGKQPIEIPISYIFNPTNYYTKTESDAQFTGKPFKVTLTKSIQNGETVWSADKTYAEILAAYQAGRDIVAIYEGAEIDLNEYFDGAFIFVLHYSEMLHEVTIFEDGISVDIMSLVDKDNVATINSQSLTRGGNITLPTPADITSLQQALANYCPIIEDTRESAVANITGVAPFDTLNDGQRILLHLKYMSENQTSLTLQLSNGQSTNAVPVFIQKAGPSVVRVQRYNLAADAFFTIIYTGSNWIVEGTADTYYQTMDQNNIDISYATARVASAKLLRDNFYLKSESDDKFAGKPFKVTITSTEQNGETTYSADKTYTEILAAYQAGRDIIAIYDGAEVDLNEYLNGGFIFTIHYGNMVHEVFITENSVLVNALSLVEENSVATINSQPLTNGGNMSLVTPEYLAQNYVHKPDVIYQYESSMTKIYGQKSGSITNNWDLTNLDLSPYKYIKVFIKGGDGNDSDSGMTSPIIVTIPLDSGIIDGGATYYSGAGITAGINNHNRMWVTFCAVDSTKTKFQIVRTISLYGTVGSDASDDGRFLYRIEGWYDIEGAETGGNTTVSTAAAVAELRQAFANYCPVIEDTRSSAVSNITGVAPFATLVDGQRIVLKMAYNTEVNTTLTLTLSDGTSTGAIGVYFAGYHSGSSQVSINNLMANSLVELMFQSSNNRWQMIGYGDYNTVYHDMSQSEINAGTLDASRTITPKMLCDNFEKIPSLVEISTTGDVTQALESNKFYRFGEVDSLTLTFTAPQSGMGIYAGKFTASANWSALSLPVTIDEASGNDPILASKRYEFNVLDNVIVIKEV